MREGWVDHDEGVFVQPKEGGGFDYIPLRTYYLTQRGAKTVKQDMQEDFSLTPTAFLILDAVLAGKPVNYRRTDPDSLDRKLYGEFMRVGRGGGNSSHRAILSLRARGFLSERDRDGYGKDAVVYEPKDDQLTSRGLRALGEHLQGKRFDPSDPRVGQVVDARIARLKFEAERDARKAQDRRESQARHDEQADKDRKAHVANVRAALVKHGLAEFSEGLDPDQVIAFAREVEGAEFDVVLPEFA